MAYGILRDAAAAEDACQQAYLKAWETRHQIRDPEALRGWLCRVVVNQSVALLRQRKVEHRAMKTLSEEPSRHRPPRLDDRELAIWALAQLSEPTRTVVAMRIIEGISGNEVKRLLGCSASEVSRRLYQGLEQMRAYLSDDAVIAR